MGSRSRRKGQRGEREAAHHLQALYPDARRGRQDRSGRDAPDVDGTPWWVKCKTLARHACLRHLEQAERDTDGRPPLVWLREDGDTRPAVLMRADTLMGLLAREEDSQ